jgi:hypothetical protein
MSICQVSPSTTTTTASLGQKTEAGRGGQEEASVPLLGKEPSAPHCSFRSITCASPPGPHRMPKAMGDKLTVCHPVPTSEPVCLAQELQCSNLWLSKSLRGHGSASNGTSSSIYDHCTPATTMAAIGVGKRLSHRLLCCH